MTADKKLYIVKKGSMLVKYSKSITNNLKNFTIFSFRFDCDSEGMICVEELKFIMSNLPVKVSSQEIDEMVSAADLDGDGKINFQEFRKMIGQ
jgi:Ca2+-binding EF-hand superfamily protein